MKLVQNPDYPELVCVRAVRLLSDLRVRLTFTDNSAREMDLEAYLHGPIFDPIRPTRRYTSHRATTRTHTREKA